VMDRWGVCGMGCGGWICPSVHRLQPTALKNKPPQTTTTIAAPPTLQVAEALRARAYNTTRFARDYYADMDKYKVPKVRDLCYIYVCVYLYFFACCIFCFKAYYTYICVPVPRCGMGASTKSQGAPVRCT